MAIDDNFLLYVKDTAGQTKPTIIEDENQIEKLEKINKVLEDIKSLTEESKKTNDKTENNKQTMSVKLDNSVYDYLNDYRKTLINKNNNSLDMVGGITDVNSIIKIMENVTMDNSKNINDLIKSNKIINQMQTDFNNKMKAIGNKFMDIVTEPVKLYSDIKSNLTEAMDFMKNPFGEITDLLGNKKEKNKLEIAGIVSGNLEIEAVKKSSSVGVAFVWFHGELKKMLNKDKGGLKDKIKEATNDGGFSIGGMAEVALGGMVGKFIATSLIPMITTILPMAIPVILGGLVAFGIFTLAKKLFGAKDKDASITDITRDPNKIKTHDRASGGNKFLDTSKGLGLGDKSVVLDEKTGKFVSEKPTGNNLLDDSIAFIRKNEGRDGAATVNIQGGKKNVAIGSIGWTKDKALNHLRDIHDADPLKFKEIMGEKITKSLTDPSEIRKWLKGNQAWNKQDKTNFETLINSDKKLYTDIDDKRAKTDVSRYLETSKKYGIEDPRAAMLFADASNLYGETGGPNLFKGKTDFESMYNIYEAKLKTGGHKQRAFNVQSMKDYNIDTSKFTEVAYNNIMELSKDSMQKSFDILDPVRYSYGAKNWKGGSLDCSGYVRAVSVAVMKDVNKAMNKNVFTQEVMRGMNTHAAGQFDNLVKFGGGEKQFDKGTIKAEDLKEGYVIGIDSTLSAGINRSRGIDHIAHVARNDKGDLVVRESESGKGVHETLVEEWVKKAEKYRKLYVTDMYKVGKLEEENQRIISMQQKSPDLAVAEQQRIKTQNIENDKALSTIGSQISELVTTIKNKEDLKENNSSNVADNIVIGNDERNLAGIALATLNYQFGVKIGGDIDVFA